MKWKIANINSIACLFCVVMLFLLCATNSAEATSISHVNVTVGLAACGDGIVQSEEDCEGDDLQNYKCKDLWFDGGQLSCDISCSFDTSSCHVPPVDPDSVKPDEVGSLVAAGHFDIPPGQSKKSTDSLTAKKEITVKIAKDEGEDTVILPKDVVITRVDGGKIDPTDLSADNVPADSLSGFSGDVVVEGALQWGINDIALAFDNPISIDIFVGTSLNGQTLSVVRSTSATSGWTSDGIISPATCTVTEGVCSFQATKASYFATTRVVSSSGTSLSSSSNPSMTSGSVSTPGCGDISPGTKAPWIYGAVSQSFDSILLSFTEADNPVDTYVLAYGTKPGEYVYGVGDMGVYPGDTMTFLVKSLSPNTIYYFRVRGGNGCATGPWSNEISAKTKELDFFSRFFSIPVESVQSSLKTLPSELKTIPSQLETVPIGELPKSVIRSPLVYGMIGITGFVLIVLFVKRKGRRKHRRKAL